MALQGGCVLAAWGTELAEPLSGRRPDGAPDLGTLVPGPMLAETIPDVIAGRTDPRDNRSWTTQ